MPERYYREVIPERCYREVLILKVLLRLELFKSHYLMSIPSRSFEYFEKYRTTIKRAQTSLVPMYNQVHLSVTQYFTLSRSRFALLGLAIQ